MYAVVKTGGKQYRVEPGSKLRVEKIEVEQGATIELDQVLMVADGESVKLGTPFVDGGKVTVRVIAHGKGKKIDIVKFRRRKHYKKHGGHRQWYTDLEIVGIAG